MKRWLRYIGLGIAGLVALVLLVGAGYELHGRHAAARDFPPPGRLVDVGGRHIQLDCRGSGTPTVVFESGLGTDGSLSWAAVHDSIARTTRACAYSRAGMLWSDPRDGVHVGSGIAEDLHAALAAAGEKAPLVLVGHSLGGPYIVTYTQRYPADVAGLVLVDASHPDQVARFREVTPMTVGKALRVYHVAAALGWTGAVRAIASSGGGQKNVPPAVMRAVTSYAPISLNAMLAEADGLDSTLAEERVAHVLGDRPLFVLTAGAPLSPTELAANHMTAAQGKRQKEIWQAMQNEQAAWSTRSQHIVVADATHYIQFDRPDVVIAAVRSVVDSVRAGTAHVNDGRAAPAVPAGGRLGVRSPK